MSSSLDDFLTSIFEALQAIAPPHLAASWDNTGALIDCRGVTSSHRVRKGSENQQAWGVFLCNDLTDEVLQEALNRHVDKDFPPLALIITYHPTPFSGMKQFSQSSREGRVITSCLANNISVYSPHTALDCAKDGMNDWLYRSLLPDKVRLNKVGPIVPSSTNPLVGQGRKVTLSSPQSLKLLAMELKKNLQCSHLQIALSTKSKMEGINFDDMQVSTIAVQAGSGASVFQGVEAELLVTGEMSHHEVIAANVNGSTVILTRHSVSERGFLSAVLKPYLDKIFVGPGVDVYVSMVDEDPLVTF